MKYNCVKCGSLNDSTVSQPFQAGTIEELECPECFNKGKKFSLSDYLEDVCTTAEWINQHNPIKLEVGKVYVQAKGTWHEHHYKILFVDDKIATGVAVWSKIGDGKKYSGDYSLFYVANGFKYQDVTRAIYRLSEEKI